MPIYAYRCAECGHTKDVLRKLSDPPLTTCPACGAEAFEKQVTAAGFQLKGSGWYVTDFRNGSNGAPGKAAAATPDSAPAPAAADAAKPAAAAPAAPAPAPAPSSGSGGSGSSGSGSAA